MMGPREVVTRYWDMESRRDLAGVLDRYAADAELVVPELGRLTGREQIRTFYAESFRRFPVLHVEIVGEVVQGDTGAFEWRSLFRDHDGRQYPLCGVNVVHVGDGRLRRVHVYYDPASLADTAQQRATGTPGAVHG